LHRKEVTDISAHSIKPSEPSVIIYVGKQNDKNDKNQNPTTESVKEFKCFYCDQLCLDDREHITHIDSEHTGKLYYPTPSDFENRLDPHRQQQRGENQ
jgi:hypothetical protein